MGGYKKTDPTVYVVSWPDGVIKVGESGKQRWRGFVIRGATVQYLATCSDLNHVLASERAGHDWLRSRYSGAFTSSQSADDYLGRNGGGWLECFRVPLDEVDQVVAAIADELGNQHASANASVTASVTCLRYCEHPMHERTETTNGLTWMAEVDGSLKASTRGKRKGDSHVV